MTRSHFAPRLVKPLTALAVACTLATPAVAANSASGGHWQRFQCDQGGELMVRYRDGATPTAQLLFDARSVTLRQTQTAGHEGRVFEGQGLRWAVDSVGRPQGANTPVTEMGGGFLTRSQMQVVNGKRLRTDAILRKACNPLGH